MIDKVLLIGCGRMGGSLLRGWRESGAVADAIVADPAAPAVPAGVTVVPDLASLRGPLPSVIILAVKPQMLDSVLPALRSRLPREALIVSIVAGKSLDYFKDRLGQAVAVIRTMPNTPAAIGRGVTVCCGGPAMTEAERATVQSLMEAVGEVAWIADESLMHAVTAVSGSGPAYLFLLIEALAEAGRSVGLPKDLAERLARGTIAGAGELARQSSDDPAKLRIDVTSPGGTTAAALQILMAEDGLPDLMKRAVAAATARSRELGKG